MADARIHFMDIPAWGLQQDYHDLRTIRGAAAARSPRTLVTREYPHSPRMPPMRIKTSTACLSIRDLRQRDRLDAKT